MIRASQISRLINGNQLTIAWYVDDTKISHVDPKVVTWLKLKKKHGKLTTKRGKKHTFVGMDIEFLENGKVKITLEDYIKECINDFNHFLARCVK